MFGGVPIEISIDDVLAHPPVVVCPGKGYVHVFVDKPLVVEVACCYAAHGVI